MDRCKLEYMIKRFDFNEKKRIIMEIDPYGDYKFKKNISRYLLDPDTKDEDVLMFVGPYTTMYFVSNKDDEFKELMEHELEEIKEEYINQYKLINELCIKNNTYQEAIVWRDEVLVAMKDLRKVVDILETKVDVKYWPMPTYVDLLFGI